MSNLYLWTLVDKYGLWVSFIYKEADQRRNLLVYSGLSCIENVLQDKSRYL